MRTIILIFSLLLCNFIFSQNETENTRWIRILKSENNQLLFNYTFLNDTSLIGKVQHCASQGDNIFYLQSDDIADLSPLYFELIANPIIDSLNLEYCSFDQLQNYQNYNEPNITIAFNSLIPFKDELGDDIITFDNSTGFELYTYPFRTLTIIPVKEIEEIRIKEIRIQNSETYQFEYIPVAIEIMPQYFGNSNSHVWIDLNKLKTKYPSIENDAWYNFIMRKEYNGKQYMQI